MTTRELKIAICHTINTAYSGPPDDPDNLQTELDILFAHYFNIPMDSHFDLDAFTPPTPKEA